MPETLCSVQTGAAQPWHQDSQCWAQPHIQVTLAESFPFFVQWLPPWPREAKPRAVSRDALRMPAVGGEDVPQPRVALGGGEGQSCFLLGSAWPRELLCVVVWQAK